MKYKLKAQLNNTSLDKIAPEYKVCSPGFEQSFVQTAQQKQAIKERIAQKELQKIEGINQLLSPLIFTQNAFKQNREINDIEVQRIQESLKDIYGFAFTAEKQESCLIFRNPVRIIDILFSDPQAFYSTQINYYEIATIERSGRFVEAEYWLVQNPLNNTFVKLVINRKNTNYDTSLTYNFLDQPSQEMVDATIKYLNTLNQKRDFRTGLTPRYKIVHNNQTLFDSYNNNPDKTARDEF